MRPPAFAKTLTRSLEKLTTRERAFVWEAIATFLHDPKSPGLSLHRLQNGREQRFWSIRAGRDIRVILLKDCDLTLFCYADHHDAAYDWASRKEYGIHPVTGAAQFVDVAEEVREVVRYIPREIPNPPLFAHLDDDYLLSLGVPPVYLPFLKDVDEHGLESLFDRLPEEAQESILVLLDGQKPEPRPVQIGVSADSLAHPDARQRFFITSDEAEIRRALERPWDQWLVFLHPSQRDAVERDFGGPARISGGAGTGKTVVALHRAARLAHSSAEDRVLLTTFSKTLAGRLAEGLDLLLGPSTEVRARIEVTNIHKLAHDICLDAGEGRLRPASGAELLSLIESRANSLGLEEPLGAIFCAREWDEVIDYWGVRTLPDYLEARRGGRGQPLNSMKRQMLWPVFETLYDDLQSRGLITWAEFCRRAHTRVKVGGPELRYRHVIVDESQDLGPAELAFLAALAEDKESATFMGDGGQQIFRYPFSWSQAGVDIRGRSRILRINYRTSREIKALADHLCPDRITGPDGEPEDRANVSILRGPEPELHACTNEEAERYRLTTWLQGLSAAGLNPREMAIFARTKAHLTQIAQPAAEEAGLPASIVTGDEPSHSDGVALATLHRAKGLEFRAVAVMGCDADSIPSRRALDAADSPAAESIILERERQLLYVGCTRARESLLITWLGEPSPFLPLSKDEAKPAVSSGPTE